MKKTLLLLAPAALLLVGCGQQEEPAEPLSPTAQAALKSGHTGPPAGVDINQGKGNQGESSRGANMKPPGGK